MENQTKYRLKKTEELETVLSGTNNLFVISCNKCFCAYDEARIPEQDAFLELARKLGKTLTGSVRLDFLCNKIRTAEALEELIPEGTDHIAVIACGLGVQTVAELTEENVLAACDSVGGAGHHGMALTDKTCGACAQCYLNLTGGICPVVDCTKGLLGGQCGGARNGKCEADPNKDCAWQKIQERLAAQGRLEELKNQGIQIRDYSKVNTGRISAYVKSVREGRFAGYTGGVHPVENKERTQNMAICRCPEPDTVAINLAQHAGAPARCTVAVGDTVKLGQKVGEAAEGISANIHASVSGKVIAIEQRYHATRGNMALSVIIENDRRYTPHPAIKPGKSLEELTGEEILHIVKEAGIVGMGGAGFPVDLKLKPGKPVDTVLLNGCECEPMLTADHRVMLEYGDDVVFGLKAMMKTVNARRGIIVIEDNKPDAIARMREKTAAEETIEVCVVATKYPQGGEKMLIRAALGRRVPRGGLPADVGCVVVNVSTSKAVSDAVQRGMPAIERVVTVTGDRVKRVGNFLVRNGTDIRLLLDHCGVTGDEAYEVKIGGPMMGTVLPDRNVAATKCTNGIMVSDPDVRTPQECIRCGRCVDVCPMELQPLHFARYYEDPAQLEKLHIMDCMECRSCAYICPSRIPLTSLIRTGKNAVRERK